jgi:hypothetical protein
MIVDLENIICQSCNTCLFKEKLFFNYMACSCNSVRYYKEKDSIYIDLNENRISIDLTVADLIIIDSNDDDLTALLSKFFYKDCIKHYESLSELYFIIIKAYNNLIFI